MLVKGIDDKEYKINLTKYHNKQRKNCSSLHARARDLIESIYPAHHVFEEVRLPGTKTGLRSKDLYADFFIPTLDMIIEVHGQQHYEYSEHYHKNKLDFYASKSRDNTKNYWCELNSISYIELPYNESDEEWRHRIIGRGIAAEDK